MEIVKDVPRTFSNYDVSLYHSVIRKIFRVLLVFLEYHNNVDYVQGMNNIVGSLCLHVEESQAFWLFVDLLESYNLDDIYLPDMMGTHLFLNQIKLLVIKNFKAVHDHMTILEVKYEMFALNWVISMFTSFMPLPFTIVFWKRFFKDGWKEFYKVIYRIFKELQDQILSAEDMPEVLEAFRQLRDDRTN